MEDLPRSVLDSIWKGRAILIAGQDLARDESSQLLEGDEPSQSLRGALSKPSSALLGRIAALRKSAADAAQVEVSQAPWALVLSSAIDTRLASALEAAAPASRRIRRRFVDDIDADSLVRSPAILEVMHLSLLADASSPDGAVPEPRGWSRVTRLMQPRVLDRLKNIAGPSSIIVIDGVSATDTLDREDLIAAFEGLDDAQIVLCGGSSEQPAWLLNTRPGVLVLAESLAEVLARARVETPSPVSTLLRAEDLTLTVRGARAGDNVTVVVRAEELRDIRRHLDIIGDAPGLVAPGERDERLRAFRTFLRTPRLRPDYNSFVFDFCLKRRAYTQLYDVVTRRVALLRGGANLPKGQPSNGPVILAGFPGSGRTTGLHWLGIRLRQDGWLVAHLAAVTDEPDLFAIEQVARLIEQRLNESGAAPLSILLVDGLGAEGAKRLDERLRRAGRRTVVVASAVRSSANFELDEEPSEATDILKLKYELETDELQDLENILRDAGISISADVLKNQAGVEGFLGMLYRLDSGAKTALAQVLRQDFERFVPDLARALKPRQMGERRGALGEAIAAAFARADRALPSGVGAHQLHPTELELTKARDLLRTIFALAWLDRPAPLDLIARLFPTLFQSYEEVRIVALEHGFLAEVAVDADGTPALTPVNPGVARVLRHDIVGYNRNVQDELRGLANVVAWPAGSDMGNLIGWPKFIYELLRSISPLGSFQREFGAVEDVQRLLEVLRDLRETHGLCQPQTLMLEAITEREWVMRADLSEKDRVEPLEDSRRLLEEARELVAQRPKSPTRDHLLASILTSYATTLRRLMEVQIVLGDLPMAEDIARPALAAAQRSQALQDNWHPFDAAALIYVSLAKAWQQGDGGLLDAKQQYLDAVDRLGAILDLGADLGDLPYDQRQRQGDRQRDYMILSGQLSLALEQAVAEAAEGRLAGLCHLLRIYAIDPVTNRIRSANEAAAAFEKLASFPAAFEDELSLVLLHRLWIGARLGDRSLDLGPYVIGARVEEWRELQRITEKKLALRGDDFNPSVGFWLALALLQVGNLPKARHVLQQMQASIGSTRKRHFDPLVLLADSGGSPRLFRALVRRREERENLLVYVRDLDLEVRLPRRHLEAGEALDLRQGDIIDVHVALNYRGPMAVGPRWATRSIYALGA